MRQERSDEFIPGFRMHGDQEYFRRLFDSSSDYWGSR